MDDNQLYHFFKSKNLPDYIIINSLLLKNNLITSFLINFKYYSNLSNDTKLLEYLDIITWNIKTLKICKFLELNSYIISTSTIIDTKCRNLNDVFKNNVLDFPINYDEIDYGIKYIIKCNHIIIKSFSIKNSDEKIADSNQKINDIKTYFQDSYFLKSKIFEINKYYWFSKKYILQNLNNSKFNITSNKLLHIYICNVLKENYFNKLNDYFYKNPIKINENKLLIKLIIGYIKTNLKKSSINKFDDFLITQVN
mgnify:CR=1 FL=1